MQNLPDVMLILFLMMENDLFLKNLLSLKIYSLLFTIFTFDNKLISRIKKSDFGRQEYMYFAL